MSDRYEKIRRALAMGPTPGPWEVANGTDVFTQLGARNAAGVEAAANDGWHIADCDMGPSSTEEGKVEAYIPYVEKRANAALIAACDPDTVRELLAERDALAALAQQPAAPSGAVNVVGMPEFDDLMDHIYEHGTTAEGVVERANAFARAVLAQYAPQQPAAVDEARSVSSIMDGAVSFVEALAAQQQGGRTDV